MATAFLSIAGNDSLNVFSKKSYVREAIRWLRQITENWHYSWKFDGKANTTESNSHCFSSANYQVFQLQLIPSNLGGEGEGMLLGQVRGNKTEGRGSGYRGWRGGFSALRRLTTFNMQPNVHKMRLLIYICFLSDLVESCLLTFALTLSMDQLTYKQKSDINSKVWAKCCEWRHTDVILMTFAVLT